MSDVRAARADRLKTAFAECLAVPIDERAACLDAACAGDAELRRRVLALLNAHSEADGFLTDATRGAPRSPDNLPPPSEAIGAKIGHYKLLQLIGEGGFGNVFMAEQQEPVVRKVALKVIKLGMDTRQVIARFEAERQALAMMDHPNIAKVFDAGATEAGPYGAGRPYFVMELVRGDPITTHCDRENLDPRERLRLFQQVCLAVQHAHTKGIIHRDLKPSNVLVTVADQSPVPKVIDFGIAKATSAGGMGGRLTDKTLFTEHRALIGTPEYMSPEQADPSGIDIDTRSDIYSLGVLLYELLTGATPFDSQVMRSGSFAEVQRLIREVDPPKPSTRISGLGENLAGIASRRRTEPGRLRRIISGDLDWIVMKCLDKERGRRYDTASDLAQDIQRHLTAEPVVAAPPSAVYRARKFVRRNRGLVVGAALLGFALSLGFIGTAFGLVQARQERDKAVIAETRQSELRQQAEVIADFMEETLRGAGPSVARGRDAAMLRDMADASAERIARGELSAAPEAELRLRLAIGNVYREIASFPQAEGLLRPAVELSRRLHPGDHVRNAQALGELALALGDQLKIEEGVSVSGDALAMLRRLNADDDAETAGALIAHASLLHQAGELDDAVRLNREGLAMLERLNLADAPEAGIAWNNLAAMHRERGELAEAEPLYQKALAIRQRQFNGDHPQVAGGLMSLGMLHYDQGDLDRAESEFQASMEMNRRLYPGDHLSLAKNLEALAGIARARNDRESILPLLQDALEMRLRLVGEDNLEVATSLHNIGVVMAEGGDMPQAATMIGRALDIRARHLVPEHQDRLDSMQSLSIALERGGQFTESADLRREILAVQRTTLPGPHFAVSRTMAALASALTKAGEHAAATEVLRECLAMRRQLTEADGQPTWHAASTMSLLGGSLTAQAGDESLPTVRRVELLREAEPLLFEAFESLRVDPALTGTPPKPGEPDRAREALQRVVDLHQLWRTLEPSPQREALAMQWVERLAEYDRARSG